MKKGQKHAYVIFEWSLSNFQVEPMEKTSQGNKLNCLELKENVVITNTHCSNVVTTKIHILLFNDNLKEQINSYLVCWPNLNFGVYILTFEALKSDNLAFYLVQTF